MGTKKILLAILFLLIGGAGCATATNNNTNMSTTTIKTAVIKAPSNNEPKNPAYDYCESQGFEIIVRFDKETNKSVAYCRFADTTECIAEDYYLAKCSPNKGAKNYHETSEQETQVCTQDYSPVCGMNGMTYTNSCVAQTQGIKIAHNGECVENVTSENTGKQTITTNANKMPDWLALTISLLESEAPQSPPAHIDRCIFGDKTTYYQSEGCPNCPSILYSTSGQVLCYPNNDYNKTCPSYFSPTNLNSSCTRVWTDKGA